MGEAEAKFWNEKYNRFYVIRFGKTGRFIQIGKPHTDIKSALASAKRHDRLDSMTFIDVVKP